MNSKIVLFALMLGLVSCSGIQGGHELSQDKKLFIEGLTILDENEDIIQCYFNAFSEKVQSMSLYSNKRVLHYYYKQGDTTELHEAPYSEIDTIEFVNNSDDWINNSYLKVYTSDVDFFNVFISGSYEEEQEFYEGALKVWEVSK